MVDPIDLARALIRCRSVTPTDDGALATLAAALEPLGFRCQRLRFSDSGTPDIDNLYARIGAAGPVFCFAGHTDVVPTGDLAGWSVDPFAAEIKDGQLFGRGAADMKGSLAAMVAASAGFLAARGDKFRGSIGFLITGDEEGPSVNGTRKVLDWMRAKGERLDACLVGEPTCESELGDMMKIGRRGSVNFRLTVAGTQGHVAYPHLADNPLPRLVRMLDALIADKIDAGTEWFQPTNLEITSIDVGNAATNVIPAKAEARINIRFNALHTGKSLTEWVRARLDRAGAAYDLKVEISGEAFLTPPGPLTDIVVAAIEKATGRRPKLSTTGGTSDARFIKDHCPVVEFGPPARTMHKVDERVGVEDLRGLAAIYRGVLDGFFPAA
ncbi:MAG: succinyl-diaminopimelate desuccinylase [Alphaproteobacteria bacterium]|nr:succinyl-diaminopimelate desuccinylase [Alphaproteobacteria bacterium]